MKIQSKNKKGFTLIEMMIVVAIIGILAVAALAAVNQLRKRSTATQVKQTATEMITALEAAALDGETALDFADGLNSSSQPAVITGTDTTNVYIPKFEVPAGCSAPGGCSIDFAANGKTVGVYDFAIGPLKNKNWWYCNAEGGCRCVKGTVTGPNRNDTGTTDAACNSA
jgi:type IV pilus assembly protein PilA